MHKLTCLDGLPRADRATVAPHNYRLLGSSVLITNDAGQHAFLSPAQYKEYLSGITETHPLWPILQPKGFLKNAFDFDAAASALLDSGLLSWKGPSTHVLRLEREGRAMDLETARRIVDFTFSVPGPQVTLEMTADAPEPLWAVIWFLVQYARRKSEWSKRPLFLILRTRQMPRPEYQEFLRGHCVTLRLEMDLKGRPGQSRKRGVRAQRVLGRVDESSREPGAWMDWLDDGGAQSVRLSPEACLAGREGVRRFLDFYAAALDHLIENAETRGIRDEWVLEFLNRAPRNLSGTDMLETLAYGPAGDVSSGEMGSPLGRVDSLRYEDLAKSELVRACVSASCAENQSLCFQCVYKSHCTLPAAVNLKSQGTLWGQTPSSLLCALHMGILDIIFDRVNSEKLLPLLNKWHIDINR